MGPRAPTCLAVDGLLDGTTSLSGTLSAQWKHSQSSDAFDEKTTTGKLALACLAVDGLLDGTTSLYRTLSAP